MLSKRTAKKIPLPGFIPGDKTVVCGRGRLCQQSPGNVFLKSLVRDYLKPYSQATTKIDKSTIVSSILNTAKNVAYPKPAFVKADEDNVFWQVDDAYAREKIGCMFRDILYPQYRSSNKAKNARKKKLQPVTETKRRQVADSIPSTGIFAWDCSDPVADSLDSLFEDEADVKNLNHCSLEPMSLKLALSVAPTRLPTQDFFRTCLPPLTFLSENKKPLPTEGFFTRYKPLSKAVRQVSIEDEDLVLLEDKSFEFYDDVDLTEDTAHLF